ncbi:hypothetical protein GCM10010411_75470 [Actinomadura fulvescens]|uniref:Uncharacterized protein n=1 Tax=Actinomadura fulvescens TaxID=46160 RepID=A0ABP6CSE1_9ACTN
MKKMRRHHPDEPDGWLRQLVEAATARALVELLIRLLGGPPEV